ncbi:hypothetical protein V8D89_002963 [Ganoderma adspersum]
MSTSPVTKESVIKIVEEIKQLSEILPKTVPIAKKTDKLYQTLMTISGESTWATFNWRMDILYGEDCRDASGRLKNIRRGAYRLGAVCTFLTEFVVLSEDGALPYDLVKVKLDRILKELMHLTSSVSLPAQGSGSEVVVAAAGLQRDRPLSSEKLPDAPDATEVEVEVVKQPQSVSGTKVALAKKAKTKQKVLPLDKYMKPQESTLLPDDEPTDKSYQPPKRPRPEPASPTQIFGSDGEEIVSSSPSSSELDEPRKAIEISDSDGVDADTPQQRAASSSEKGSKTSKACRSSSNKYKCPEGSRKKSKRSASPSGELDISSGNESNGQGALLDVEAREAAKGAKCGPQNESIHHWHDPIPVWTKDGLKWEFKCRYCSSIRRFKRTITGLNPRFEDESPQPILGNLSTHIRDKHPAASKAAESKDLPAEDGKTAVNHGYMLASARVMEEYVRNGYLNSALEPTQKGFYRVFAAWILEDDLPFSQGESWSLRNVFKYLKVNFILPTDTTVRNVLTKIFTDLHGKVVCKFTCIKSKIAFMHDTWTNRQMIFTFAGTLANFIDDDWCFFLSFFLDPVYCPARPCLMVGIEYM